MRHHLPLTHHTGRNVVSLKLTLNLASSCGGVHQGCTLPFSAPSGGGAGGQGHCLAGKSSWSWHILHRAPGRLRGHPLFFSRAGAHGRACRRACPVICICSPPTQLLGPLLVSRVSGSQRTEQRATPTNAGLLSPPWSFNLTFPRSRIHTWCRVGALSPCLGSGIFLQLWQPTAK